MLELTGFLKDPMTLATGMDDENTNSDSQYDVIHRHLQRESPVEYKPSTSGSVEPPLSLFTKVLVAFAATGGFLFGYDTGVVSGALILLKEEFQLSTLWQELVVSMTIAAAAVASFLGGPLNDQFGRRPVIILASLVFTVGAVLMGLSPTKELLLAGRVVVGLGVGLASMTTPMYIAESAPTHLRGRLVTINNLFITGGQLVASLIDGGLSYWSWGWRLMLGLGAVPAAVQLIGFLFLPESPRWLILHNKPARAVKVLGLIYGRDSPLVGQELRSITADVHMQQQEKLQVSGSQWMVVRILKTPAVLRAIFVGCGLQMFQQLAGINTVMYYSATIIRMSGVKNNSTVIWLAAVIGFTNFIFTFVGVYLVERIGRRALTLGSLAGVTFSQIFLGVGFLLMAIHAPNVTLDNPMAGTCSLYSNCDKCILQEECGFCYQMNGSAVVNASCLPLNQSDPGHSEVGRCSAGDQDGSSWSEDFCPTSFGIMALIGLIMYLMFFAPGMGPMPWTINSEIYPQWARSTCNSLSSTTNWLSNLLISMTFLSLTEIITREGTFFMYAGICAVGFLFIYLVLPETKGRPLEEVTYLFSKPLCPCSPSEFAYTPLEGSTHQSGGDDQSGTNFQADDNE